MSKILLSLLPSFFDLHLIETNCKSKEKIGMETEKDEITILFIVVSKFDLDLKTTIGSDSNLN